MAGYSGLPELLGWREVFDKAVEQPDLGSGGLGLLVFHVLLQVRAQLLELVLQVEQDGIGILATGEHDGVSPPRMGYQGEACRSDRPVRRRRSR